MAVQFFKGDETEKKYYNSVKPISDTLNAQKNLFYDDAYGCYVLGELLYDNGYAPLSNAIPREIFRETFKELFDSFISAGTFEGYLSVLRKVFGADVVVEFSVPGPGQLNIDVEASGVVESYFTVRRIVDNEYVYDHLVTQDGDNIMLQTVKGFRSQYDLEQMLFEMVPDGIYTEITLTLGS